MNIGRLIRREITPPGLIQTENLADIDDKSFTLVVTAGSDKLVFSSREISLPSRPGTPMGEAVFLLDLKDSSAAPRKIGAGMFAVSPDGKFVAFSGDNAVSVLELATGKTEVVQKVESQTGVAPAWKSNTELSFIVPAGTPGGPPQRAEVVIWDRDAKDKAIRGSPATGRRTSSTTCCPPGFSLPRPPPADRKISVPSRRLRRKSIS